MIGSAAIAHAIPLRIRNNATDARGRGRLDREGLQKFMKIWALNYQLIFKIVLISCFTAF